MSYLPLTQREYFLVHIGFVPDPPDYFQHAPPSTARPTRPVMPDMLTTSELAQVNGWLSSPKDAASDAAVTLPNAISKRDAFKAFYAADRAWVVSDHVGRLADWHGTYVDEVTRRHNSGTVPPSQTTTGTAVSAPASPVPRNVN